MHSLYFRIFVLFWVAMALIVGGSIAITFTIAAHEYEAPELQRRPPVAARAAEVLAHGGLGALRRWLDENKSSIAGRDLYIIGSDGADILGRRLSEAAVRRLEFFNRDELAAAAGSRPFAEENRGAEAPDAAPRDAPPYDIPPREAGARGGRPFGPPRGRPLRASPFIVASDGQVYTVLLAPRRPSIFGALSLPEISLAILCIALAVSALASWWLARHLSAPIRRIQEGARALATESLDVRVSAGLDDRKDEVAVLARDFDAMADRLRANRAATTRLLRDISHELRSPLARMRVALGLARQPPADISRQLDRLEKEVERLDALISQVLKLARLQGSDATFTPETVDLDEIIEEVVRDAGFEGAAKRCRIERSGITGVSLRGNPELLRSAIENVLRNAVHYSPADAPVELDVARSGEQAVIVVRDHGPGVPAADLERIFQPFYRVAESRDRDSGGEGIGLAITAQVMKAHAGSARAVNLDRGFEVRLTLPLRAPAD